MNRILILVTALAGILHAETDEQFGERVAKAWNSKKASDILALYGDTAKMDPGTKEVITIELIDFHLKNGFDKATVDFLPADPLEQRSYVLDKKIFYLTSEILGRIAVNLTSGKKSRTLEGRIITSFTEDAGGNHLFSVHATKAIEWTGGDPPSYKITLSTLNPEILPQSTIAVVEKYGYIEWIKIGKSATVQAHKILSLVISPTPEALSLDVEIAKGTDEPFFIKTVTTDKGAVIQIDP